MELIYIKNTYNTGVLIFLLILSTFRGFSQSGTMNVKVFLQGALSGSSMTTDLNDHNLIPLTDPYGLRVKTTITTLSHNSITDWILVELRSTPGTITESLAALLRNDGTILNPDGSSPLKVTASSGSYYVSVRHRNHLGVMTANPVTIGSTVDFTSASTAIYGGADSQVIVGAVNAMWGGNATGLSLSGMGSVKYGSYLVSSTLIATLTRDQVIANSNGIFGTDLYSNLIIQGVAKSGIKVYKLIYNTKHVDNTPIQASGLLIIPSTTDPMPMISFQHGTQFDETDAPSYYKPDNFQTKGLSLFASGNNILSCPDYIGYGVSKNIDHPYMHRESIAQTSLDMTRASIEFIKQQNVTWNTKLMLTGYSEGGFATMSLLKKIEEQYPTEFNLTAASCGAGGYDISLFMKTIINETTSGISMFNNFYAFVFRTYNKIYNKINRPINYYFKEPYASIIQNDGVNGDLTGSFNLMVTDSAKNGINNGTDIVTLYGIKDNDCFDWKSATPLRLYHGTSDVTVYYNTSQATYDAMIARGTSDVQLVPIQGQDHTGTIRDYMLQTFAFFSLKNIVNTSSNKIPPAVSATDNVRYTNGDVSSITSYLTIQAKGTGGIKTGVYTSEDTNLDGTVRYSGKQRDLLPIINTISSQPKNISSGLGYIVNSSF